MTIPPFQFSAAGAIELSSDVPARRGVQIFISRYAQEWLKWHGAGCRNLTVCDLAAFRVAAIHCYYFDHSPWSESIAWLNAVFGVPAEINVLEFDPAEIPDETLQALAQLRPWSATLPDCTTIQSRAELGPFAPLFEIACPLEHLLVLGGDNRFTLDPKTLLNGYGCRPFPRPEAITFSSSTASSISQHAFDATEKRRQEFINDAIRHDVGPAAAKLSEEVRTDLLKVFEVTGAAQVVLSSSGTDSFMLVQGLLRLLAGSAPVCLMIGADESGTGVPLAAQERHFAAKTALGKPVEKGELLHEARSDGNFVNIAMRDTGHQALLPESLDQRVRDLAEQHFATGAPVAIYAMNYSKLGLAGPSKQLLLELKQRHGDRLQVVIDACQLRLDASDIQEFLREGFPVIITGSKYFTGPPLSGAVLIPQQMASKILGMTRDLPRSFSLYCAKYDLPVDFQNILTKPQSHFNLGSYFRWAAAITEMKRYFRIPAPSRKKALDHFQRKVEPLLLSRHFLELQYTTALGASNSHELSGRRMIFPFFLVRQQGKTRTVCTEEEIRTIYSLLNQDCSERFPTRNAREYRRLSQRCHVGQPVKALHPSGHASAVLRINVGARIVSESWSEEDQRIEIDLIEDELWQVGVILDKIELLLAKAFLQPA